MADLPTLITSPTGETVELRDPSQLDAAKAQGYTLATADAAQDFNRQEQLQAKYGDTAGQLKAFGAGAARTATFGLSDVVMRGLGVDKETLSGLQEANPTASGFGEATGIAGSMLIPGLGEASAVGRVAQAGRGVAHAAEAVLPEATSALGRIAKHAIAQGAGMATEGAAYGMGHEVSEAALGDPNQTASSVIQHIGLSALFGAGAGAAFGVGEAVVPKLVDAAGQGIKKLTDKIGEVYPEWVEKTTGVPSEYAKAVIDARATTPEAAEAVLRDKLIPPRPVAVEPTQGWAREVADNLQETHDALIGAAKEGAKFRPVEIEQLAAEIDPRAAGIKLNQAHDLLRQAADNLDREAAEGAFVGNMGAKVRRVADGLREAIENGNPVEQQLALIDARRNLSSLGKAGRRIEDALDRDALKTARALADQLKEATLDTEAWGESAVRTAKFNYAKADFDRQERLFRKYFVDKETGKVDPGMVERHLAKWDTTGKDKVRNALEGFLRNGSAYKDAILDSANNAGMSFDAPALESLTNKSAGALRDARQAAEYEAAAKAGQAQAAGMARDLSGSTGSGMSWFETGMLGHALNMLPGGRVLSSALYGYRMVRGLKGTSVTSTVGYLSKLEGLNKAISGTIKRNADTLVRGGARVSAVGRAEAEAGISSSHADSAEDQRRIYEQLMKRIDHLSDPGVQMDHVHGLASPLLPHAPNTGNALMEKTSAAIQHLKMTAPQQDPPALLTRPRTPNSTEVSKWLRRVDAIENPTSLLKHAAAGTLTKEHVEAVAAVHPELLDAMKQQILDSHAGYRGIVPMKARTGMGMLLGQPVTTSRNAQSLQTTAGLYKSVAQGGPQAPNPTASKASKLSVAERSAEGTTSQARQNV